MKHEADLKSKLEDANCDVLQEIVRLAESRLQAQLSTALACDQRAMTFLGFITAATALLAGTAVTAPAGLAAISGGACIGFALAGYFAFRAGRPVVFDLVGNEPSSFEEELSDTAPLKRYLLEQAVFYDDMIKQNRTVMDESSRYLRNAAGLAELTVAIGAGAAIVFRLYPS